MNTNNTSQHEFNSTNNNSKSVNNNNINNNNLNNNLNNSLNNNLNNNILNNNNNNFNNNDYSNSNNLNKFYIEHPLTDCTQTKISSNTINFLHAQTKKNFLKKKNSNLSKENYLIKTNNLIINNEIHFSEPNLNYKRRSSILNIAPEISINKKRNLAIHVKNICHTYGEGENTNYVLNGVNLNVPKGEIYGLLGPSGCGKTTLLKIICGLLKPEYGVVKLFGYSPDTLSSGVPGPGIGYMPQELALQRDLTIGEMLAFYGRLCLLSEEVIAQQTDYLIDLLELPSKDRLISKLSGGQKRRVSLAVTIIHKPRVVVLDEPTVGVDPLLCQKIWGLLIDLSVNQKITIIITTHYIEETRRANLVGFMRKGQILTEGNPDQLIQYYNTDGLENVFYKLCLNQKKKKTTVESTHLTRKISIIQNDKKNSFRNYDFVNDLEKSHERHASFTSLFNKKNLESKYPTPLGSPEFEQKSNFKLNVKNIVNAQILKKKNETMYNKYLELKVLNSQLKHEKKIPLEDISNLPILYEKFKVNYYWNPILIWFWLIIATSYKLALQILRQPMFLFILYLFPTFCMASLYLCIGHTPKNIKVGLIVDEKKDHRHRWDNFPNIPCNPKNKKVDYDYLFKMYEDLNIKNRTKIGDYEFDYFDKIPDIGVYDKLRVPYIPDIIIANVNKEIINFLNYSNIKEAQEDVRKMKIRSYLHFKKEFSRSFIESNIFLKVNSQKNITNAMIDQGRIHISGDFSDLFIYGTIQLTLFEAIINSVNEIVKKCDLKPGTAKLPIEVKEIVYGEYIKGDYYGIRNFVGPGFIMCITYSLSMGLSTLQTLMELQDQMYVRNFSVGLSAGQMIIANILGKFPFMLGSTIMMLIASINLFQIPIYGSYFDAFHILFLQTLVGMSNGLLFATFIKNIITCLFLSLGFLFFIFFISGVFWPLESLPYYIRWFSKSMPFTVPCEAFRTILIRKNAPISFIYPGMLISYVWLIVFIFLSHYFVKKKKFE